MPTKTINGTTYRLQIDRDAGQYWIVWRTSGRTWDGFARYGNEYEAAAVWAALGEQEQAEK
jgi:hypothetical protein